MNSSGSAPLLINTMTAPGHSYSILIIRVFQSTFS